MLRNCTPGLMAQAGPAHNRSGSRAAKEWFTFRAQPRACASLARSFSPWKVAVAAHLERQPNGRSFFANRRHQELIHPCRSHDAFAHGSFSERV
jgi:hypothetical protein